jgi:hypothetical protein
MVHALMCVGATNEPHSAELGAVAIAKDMLDAFYLLLALVFFAGCWVFTKACDRL